MQGPLQNCRVRRILHLLPVFAGLIAAYITRTLQKIAANTKNRVFNLPNTFSNECVHYIFAGCGKCESNTKTKTKFTSNFYLVHQINAVLGKNYHGCGVFRGTALF
jgi:hypothetical protein